MIGINCLLESSKTCPDTSATLDHAYTCHPMIGQPPRTCHLYLIPVMSDVKAAMWQAVIGQSPPHGRRWDPL
ncbi:hypothetical protein Tco_0929788 [Tanacetum coccineum]